MKRTLAAFCAALALAACASPTDKNGSKATPAPVAAHAHVDVAGQATASFDVTVFGFPATHVAARADAGGTLDLDTSRTPPVVLTGSWSIQREDVPPGAPAPVGLSSDRVGTVSPCAPPKPVVSAPAPCAPPKVAAPAPSCDRTCEWPPPPAPPAAAAPDICGTAKVGAAPPAKAEAPGITIPIPKLSFGGLFGCDEAKRGQPVYVGCSGTAGGNRPEPYGDVDRAIPPGTGWPCSKKSDKVGASIGCPTGFAAILQGLADIASGHYFTP